MTPLITLFTSFITSHHPHLPSKQKLTYINLCYCEHISDAGVDLLARLPSLVSLDITGCNVSDMGVASLRNNPHFLHLVIAEVTEVADDGLQKMLSTLERLESLDISDCEVR